MNNQNLLRKEDLTPEQRKASASRAGKASAAARKKKKTLKQVASLLLGMEVSNEDVKAKMQEMGIEDEDLTVQMSIVISMMNRALQGDTKAMELLMAMSGEDIKSKELEEKTRNNKEIEKLKSRELDIKEKAIENGYSTEPLQQNQKVIDIVRQMAEAGGKGLEE